MVRAVTGNGCHPSTERSGARSAGRGGVPGYIESNEPEADTRNVRINGNLFSVSV